MSAPRRSVICGLVVVVVVVGVLVSCGQPQAPRSTVEVAAGCHLVATPYLMTSPLQGMQRVGAALPPNDRGPTNRLL